jgi:hypothetical protein
MKRTNYFRKSENQSYKPSDFKSRVYRDQTIKLIPTDGMEDQLRKHFLNFGVEGLYGSCLRSLLANNSLEIHFARRAKRMFYISDLANVGSWFSRVAL